MFPNDYQITLEIIIERHKKSLDKYIPSKTKKKWMKSCKDDTKSISNFHGQQKFHGIISDS